MTAASGVIQMCTFEVQTSGNPGGAIAVVLLRGDIASPLRAVGLAQAPSVGALRVAHLAGVDQAVVARLADDAALIMPHANPGALAALCRALESAGCARLEAQPDPRARYPEANDLLEACMLDALAHAPSPRAVDMLLDQPRRWRAWQGGRGAAPASNVAHHSAILDRLLRPPTVVAVGEANIGKSALLNALARRAVSIVADEPGVTRDHVGASLDLDGLTVWWVDTPGLRDAPGAIEDAARRAVAPIIAAADLLLSCADHSGRFVDAALTVPGQPQQRVIRVGLRSDLGPVPGAALATSALTGHGLPELAEAVREALLPADSLAWPGPWRFHHALPG